MILNFVSRYIPNIMIHEDLTIVSVSENFVEINLIRFFDAFIDDFRVSQEIFNNPALLREILFHLPILTLSKKAAEKLENYRALYG